MIPKIVYQTWYNKNEIPYEYIEIIKHNKKLNPEYQFILFDDNDLENLFKNANKEIKKAYFRINPHYGPSRSDLFRYYIIYSNGGIYLDIKIKCIQPFRNYVDNNDFFLLSYWEGLYFNRDFLNNQKGELQNWHVISRKNNKLLGSVINEIINKINNITINESKFITGKQGVLNLTGPLIYTKILEKNLNLNNNLKFFDSRKYLDYGDNFYGLSFKNYVHYSNLNEPILLNNKNTIPNIIFNYNYEIPGIYIYYKYNIINNLESLILNCNLVFCKKYNNIYMIAYDAIIDLNIFINHINNVQENQEKIYYFNNQFVKQVELNKYNEIIFHNKKYIKFINTW